MKQAVLNRHGRCAAVFALTAAVWFATSRAGVAQTLLLEGGRIIPVAGPEIKKGDILIEDGRIMKIIPRRPGRGGAKTDEVPFDAKVIDVSGKVLFPGMIDVHTTGGLDVPNESPPVTPFLNVYDAIDPSQLFFEDALRDGVTSIHVIPGNNCVIAGLSRVVHPIGMTPDEMTTAPDVAIKLSLSPKRGFDRMLQMATFRETFAKLDEDMAKLAERRYEETLREEKRDLDVAPEEAQERGRKLIRDEDVPEKDRNLLRLTQGKLRAFVYCGKAMDVPAAVALSKAHGFFDQSVFVLGGECYKAIDALKKAGRPVVLDADLIYREIDPITGEEKETFVPSLVDQAGLKFALQRKRGASLGERYLWYQAARCVREGISRPKALKAITVWPAEMLGLGDRLGSIEPDKDANILVLSGDPLDAQTWVERVFVQGAEVYDRDEDIRLKRLLAPPEAELGPSATAGNATTGSVDAGRASGTNRPGKDGQDRPRRPRRDRPRRERP